MVSAFLGPLRDYRVLVPVPAFRHGVGEESDPRPAVPLVEFAVDGWEGGLLGIWLLLEWAPTLALGRFRD